MSGFFSQLGIGVLTGVIGAAILSLFKPLSARRLDTINFVWLVAVSLSVSGAGVFFSFMTLPFGMILELSGMAKAKALIAVIGMYVAIAAFSGYLSVVIYESAMKKIHVNR